jgi:hypothetical protein
MFQLPTRTITPRLFSSVISESVLNGGGVASWPCHNDRIQGSDSARKRISTARDSQILLRTAPSNNKNSGP